LNAAHLVPPLGGTLGRGISPVRLRRPDQAGAQACPQTLSQGRFVYLADRACARAERGLKGHRNPRSYDEALRDLQKLLIPAYERLLFDLHGLAPPPSEAVAYRRLLATLNNEDLVIHHTVDALDQIQRQRVRTGLRRLRVLDRRVAVRAKRVGLKTCGKK
jgi:hypothetical protein